MIPNNPSDPATVLRSIHTPVALIHGEQAQDVAYPASVQNARAIESVPVFEAWQQGMSHLGTYRQENGGFFATIGVAWLDWRLKGKTAAARMFKGVDCTLCADPSWHVFKKAID